MGMGHLARNRKDAIAADAITGPALAAQLQAITRAMYARMPR
jgi:hypothetical protein